MADGIALVFILIATVFALISFTMIFTCSNARQRFMAIGLFLFPFAGTLLVSALNYDVLTPVILLLWIIGVIYLESWFGYCDAKVLTAHYQQERKQKRDQDQGQVQEQDQAQQLS